MTTTPAQLLELDVRNDLAALGTTLDAVHSFLKALNICQHATGQVMVIVDELASNIAKYAWPAGEEHSFSLKLRASAEEADGTGAPGGASAGTSGSLRLMIELEDDGIAFDPSATPMPDLDAPLDARQEGGLGWMLVRSMSDEFAHRRVKGRNHLLVGKSAHLA